MANHLWVRLAGGKNQTVFYWCEVKDSLENLKKRIDLRFHIPSHCQNITKDCLELDEETFKQLYIERFQQHVELDVEISDSFVGDIRILLKLAEKLLFSC